MSNFKKASKEKLRFNTSKGYLGVEQLWDLSLTNLATLVRAQKKVIDGDNVSEELSFLDSTNKTDATEQLRFEILKEVYIEKKNEKDSAKKSLEVKEHNEKIMALIHAKQEEELQSKSVEDLKSMLL